MRDVGTMVKMWAALVAIWALLMIMLLAASPSSAADEPDGDLTENERYFVHEVSGEGRALASQNVPMNPNFLGGIV